MPFSSFKNLILSCIVKLSCLFSGASYSKSNNRRKLLDDLESGTDNSNFVTKPHCPFCDVSEEQGFDILFKEENLIVFRDRSPAAVEHLQVVPIKHGSLSSVKDLNPSHIHLLREMQAAGHRALDLSPNPFPPEKRVLGFHIPPFTSVSHLHLHVHGLPYYPSRGFKYPIVSGENGNTKGWSYFLTISQAIEILEKGKNITASPC